MLGGCTDSSSAQVVSPESLFKGLRPNTILQASAKIFSKTLQIQPLLCEGLYRGDPEADIAMMGFKRRHQCAELISLMMVLVEQSVEWGETVMVTQIDCTSVRQCPAWRSACKYEAMGGP